MDIVDIHLSYNLVPVYFTSRRARTADNYIIGLI